MVSALTVLLLGCWLARQSGVSGQGSYPKPSISVSPGGVIPVGGNVTIRCRNQRLGMRIFLYKAGDGNYLTYTDPAGSEAEFPITSARREHGGSYTCRYSNRTIGAASSEPSDPVQIIVADPSLPRPSISLRLTGVTAPGADATIRCQGQRRDVRFFLHKAGDLNPQRHMDTAGDRAEFRIPTVGRQHGGSYSCSYRPRSQPFISSQPSDSVQLVVAEPSYPKPNISLRPSGRVTLWGAVTIRCECRCAGTRVLLSKAGDPNAQRSMDSVGDVVEFPIRNVSRGDVGSYSCRYSTKWDPPVWSEPSDPVELMVTEPSYPKPFISLHPSGPVVLGGAVTVRCECQCAGTRVLLSKTGDPDIRRSMDSAGDVVEFPIRNVSRGDSGSYSCQYSTKWDPPIWSEPSDPVELVVTEGSYPKPSISVSPGGVIPMGGNVTIRCRHQHLGMRFLLYKAGDGNYLTYTDPAGSEAEFPITSARREHGGNYTCRYSNRTGRAAFSEPSDPVQIIVADPSLPRPSISLSFTSVTTPGADAIIRCQGPRRDVRFFLHKAGDQNPPRHMDPAEDGAEFRIPTVGRQHGGSYSCSYRNRSEPFISSQPSDTVQLMVAEGTNPAGTQQTDPPPTELAGEGGTDPTQPGMVPTPSHPGNARPGGSEPLSLLDLTHTIITGMSVAAAGLLLLLVAFVCYRRTGGRKGPAPRQSRESEAVKALPSQPQETDSGAEELTYTELGHQAKPGGSAPAPEPVLYATINVSWRHDGQSPGGAGCPPPTPIA
ncbi:leukocyte immunoglobulin-like receptor subfamily A member 1 [Malaclemys terrapin pileata]|uniref:leukocyte immunoglobulin-like receptor subfamily A member 1 n=1 Tax=Malaclemys terrapin pileata TaxID=2991368 RepID=UPI0023A86478|nr:leukocyte immunoglobulin-like receptor subfamily A member 1 [Malaclemys terrapin pileata]